MFFPTEEGYLCANMKKGSHIDVQMYIELWGILLIKSSLLYVRNISVSYAISFFLKCLLKP